MCVSFAIKNFSRGQGARAPTLPAEALSGRTIHGSPVEVGLGTIVVRFPIEPAEKTTRRMTPRTEGHGFARFVTVLEKSLNVVPLPFSKCLYSKDSFTFPLHSTKYSRSPLTSDASLAVRPGKILSASRIASVRVSQGTVPSSAMSRLVTSAR